MFNFRSCWPKENESVSPWVEDQTLPAADEDFIEAAIAHAVRPPGALTADKSSKAVGRIPVFHQILSGSDCDGWSWHVDPKNVGWAELAVEVCDASPRYIEEHSEAWRTSPGRWCPWKVQVLKVEDRRGKRPEFISKPALRGPLEPPGRICAGLLNMAPDFKTGSPLQCNCDGGGLEPALLVCRGVGVRVVVENRKGSAVPVWDEHSNRCKLCAMDEGTWVEKCSCATITAVWSACDTFWEIDTTHSGAITRQVYMDFLKYICPTVNTLRMLRRARPFFAAHDPFRKAQEHCVVAERMSRSYRLHCQLLAAPKKGEAYRHLLPSIRRFNVSIFSIVCPSICLCADLFFDFSALSLAVEA
ncbi:unnamed protein product [Symbiodinium sp. CCMP2592]|nr:unnamed protein product [Symbiodinium sp. CCMP2592]